MYIVRDKQTKKVLHINPAPLAQKLEGSDVYFMFDGETMEIGASEGELPDDYDIEDGKIVERTLEQRVALGMATMPEGYIARGNQVVAMTLVEQVRAGTVSLDPHEKIASIDGQDQIVEKTLGEKVAEGIIELRENEQIFEVDGVQQIKVLTPEEMAREGILSLEEFKARLVEEWSQVALMERQKLLPDFKIVNAALGIYEDDRQVRYRSVVEAFREEFHRIKAAIVKARDIDSVLRVKANFPSNNI